MKIETILDAHTLTVYMMASGHQHHERRYRQRDAFRARILKMDAEKDERIVELEGHNYALNLYIEETEMDSEKSLVKGVNDGT